MYGGRQKRLSPPRRRRTRRKPTANGWSKESFEMMMITTIIPKVVRGMMMVTTILGILGKDHILANYQNCCRHLHPPPQHQQGLQGSNEVRCQSVSYPVTLETETSEVTEAPRYYCGWVVLSSREGHQVGQSIDRRALIFPVSSSNQEENPLPLQA